MITEVFDDWKSFVHSVVGGLSYFFPLSLSSSWHTRLQSTSSSMNLSSSRLEIFWSFSQATHSSDYFISFSSW